MLGALDVDVVATTDSGEHATDLACLRQPHLARIDWDMRYFGGALTARLIGRYAPDVTPLLLLDRADTSAATEWGSDTPFWSVTKHAGEVELRSALDSIVHDGVASTMGGRAPARAEPSLGYG
jgi:DNA-binding NarL/FixJ family response regulator